jgi:hypothetical protein
MQLEGRLSLSSAIFLYSKMRYLLSFTYRQASCLRSGLEWSTYDKDRFKCGFLPFFCSYVYISLY